MKILLLVSRATNAETQNRGDVIDVSDAEAVSMINAGQAEPFRSTLVEHAVVKSKAEKAVR